MALEVSATEPLSAYKSELISISRGEYEKLRWDSHYWEGQFKAAAVKIEAYKVEIGELKAQIQKLNHRIFGKSSEKSKGGHTEPTQLPKGKRGKKLGAKGFGRKCETTLPTTVEERDLSEAERGCPKCGKEYDPLAETVNSELIEIKVEAHRRIIKRKRYKRSCHCSQVPMILAASVEPKVIPKGKFGVSFHVQLLLDKYHSHLPLNRIAERLRLLSLKISLGTISDNLVHLGQLMSPIYEAIAERNKSEHHWHADETRWMVFAHIPGKTGHRWYLWVFKSETSVFFKIAPTRGAKVVQEHFSESYGILNVDRYSSYKTLLNLGNFLLAYCWAHVRRDFLEVEKGDQNYSSWSQEWVGLIGELYHTNNARVRFMEGTNEFAVLQKQLEEQICSFKKKLISELALFKDERPKSRHGVIQSLLNHWEGLILFVRYAWVPMDNNTAEQALRGPVVARKGYYGSGSEESALCAAEMFSIFGTLEMWGINPKLWLGSYLEACALNGGKPPDNIDQFLPWKMAFKRLKELGGEAKLKAYSQITREEIQCATVDEAFLKKKLKSSDKLSLKRRPRNIANRSQERYAGDSTGGSPLAV